MSKKLEDDGLTRSERNFAREVRRLREEQGWSQGDLVEKMQKLDLPYVTQSTVSRIENLTRPVRMVESQALSRIFGRTVSAMTDPDSREAWLHSAETAGRSARRKYVALRDLAAEVAIAQHLLERDLAELKTNFGDLSTLDEESRELYEHLLLNIQSFTDMEIADRLHVDMAAAKARTDPNRVMSATGLAGMIAKKQRKADDGEHQEAP